MPFYKFRELSTDGPSQSSTALTCSQQAFVPMSGSKYLVGTSTALHQFQNALKLLFRGSLASKIYTSSLLQEENTSRSTAIERHWRDTDLALTMSTQSSNRQLVDRR